MNTRFAIAMARRETRTSARRLALYGSCMALGIAALVGLDGLRASVTDALGEQAQRLLGADLRLASHALFPAGVEARVAELESSTGTPAARVTQFASMVLAAESGRTRLADVRATTGAFPFYGEIHTEPPGAWGRLGSPEPLALVDESLLIQLDAPVGSTLALGEARFRIAGTLTRAPGSVGVRTQIAPRVFIAGRHLEATGLIRPGSLVDHLLYIAAPAARLEPWLDANRTALETERVRIQTVESYQADLGRSFATVTRYLGLVGLAALALGGVGVAAGVRVFVREKLDAVALLRCLGASTRDVLAAYGVLALGLGAASGIAGAALGVSFQWLLPELVRGLLPVSVEPRLEPTAILTGIGLGLWVTTLFAAAPLLELARVAPLRALRRGFEPALGSGPIRTAFVVALSATVLGASLWQAPTPKVGLGFAVGLGAALACLAGAAAGAAALLRRVRPRRAPYWLRQGIANLSRPRNHTVATSLAIGFGLFVIATLHAVQYNVLHQLAVDARPDRPNLVLFDVQRDQVADLEAFLAERDVPVLEHAPVISARIAGIDGRDTAAWLAEVEDELDRDRRWALRR
ncbi:MAG: permease, partial [Myxococcota bacterium]|nr:permease [Myxococcota bacterium]